MYSYFPMKFDKYSSLVRIQCAQANKTWGYEQHLPVLTCLICQQAGSGSSRAIIQKGTPRRASVRRNQLSHSQHIKTGFLYLPATLCPSTSFTQLMKQ